MNSKLKFIFERRSIRKYSDKDLSNDMLRDILEAGMAAPSAMAKDPWHFVVVRDRSQINEIIEVLPNGKMLKDAPVMILVAGDIDVAHGNLESYMLQKVLYLFIN